MITDSEKKMILNSWRLVVPIADTAADLFYKRLFELKPEYRSMFPDNMDRQKDKLVRMLSFIVKALDWGADEWAVEVDPEDDLFMVVLAMGRRHGNLYRIPDSSYPVVGEALLWTLDQGLGDAFTPELKEAWTKLYGTLAMIMQMGSSVGKVDIDLGRTA